MPNFVPYPFLSQPYDSFETNLIHPLCITLSTLSRQVNYTQTLISQDVCQKTTQLTSYSQGTVGSNLASCWKQDCKGRLVKPVVEHGISVWTMTVQGLGKGTCLIPLFLLSVVSRTCFPKAWCMCLGFIHLSRSVLKQQCDTEPF